ncbi:unnamed protein product [Penicillium discolor]
MTAIGLPDFGPVQNNVSFNDAVGTTRGIHAEPWDKWVSVATGRIFGAWVDLREGPTFGAVFTAEIDPSKAIFVPRGVGNSYQTLEPDTAYTYLVNDHWSADASYSFLNLADESVAIDWPIPLSEVEISEKDRTHPRLADVTPIGARKTLVVGAGGQYGLTLVHVSSDYVFDGSADRAYREDDAVCPLGVYGQSKAAGDLAVTTVPRHYVVRTSWVIGDGKNFVRTMASLAERGIAPKVVDDQRGRLTFATEIARAIVHLLSTRAPTAEYFASAEGPVAPRPSNSVLDLAKIEATGFVPIDAGAQLEDYLRGPPPSDRGFRVPPTRTVPDLRGAGYRADIDGLRTLAIVLVVIYHVWFGRVSGGVDVFLMISAFLLTGSLARRAEAGTPLALPRFWIRRFRRLVPAAAATLLAVLAAAAAFFPPTQWTRIWNETWASLFYVQNWQLAFSAVDYYARDSSETSPLQHFWSLSIQGQVFLLWPLLIFLVALLLRRRRDLVRPTLVGVFLVIFVWSLWFSIVETRADQAFAYFDTRTRLGRFPGFLALWPVLCAAAVIVSGVGDTRGGPASFLASKPMTFLSGDAYALYLVHWPILVTGMVLWDVDRVGLGAGTLIILCSLVAARLLSRGIERPLRESSRTGRAGSLRGLAVIAASVVVVAGVTGTWRGTQELRAAEIAAEVADSHYPGAAQVGAAIDIAGGEQPLIPLPTALEDEWSLNVGAETAEHRVLVIGDSHAQQLSIPLNALFEDDDDVAVITLLHGGCTAGLFEESRSLSLDSCETWVRAAFDYAKEISPDAVYIVVTRADASAPERLLRGVEDVVAEMRMAGIPVIGNPAEALGNDITLVDFTPWLCPSDVCEAVIGNVAVYIDDNHLSGTYARTLTPVLEQILAESGDGSRALSVISPTDG